METLSVEITGNPESGDPLHIVTRDMCQVEEGLRHGWSRDNREQRGQLSEADRGPGLLHCGPEVGGQAHCGQLTLSHIS